MGRFCTDQRAAKAVVIECGESARCGRHSMITTASRLCCPSLSIVEKPPLHQGSNLPIFALVVSVIARRSM
jgi:hypothetical protein